MGLLDKWNELQAYISANTPKNTRPRVSPAKVIDEGLFGGAIGRVPDNAQAMYQGLLNAPQELAQLGGKGSAESVRNAYANPKQANPQQWMDAGMELSGMAPVGGLLAHTVYHGSPHKFSKFDMSKIGTGEGAQAYGHGLYMAESPDVAKSYLGAGSKQPDPKTDIHGWVKWMRGAGIDEDVLVGMLKNDGITTSKAKNIIQQSKEIGTEGSFYKVDIPDEAIPKMLDWDKPLSEQSKEVQAAIKKSSFYKDGRKRFKETKQWYDDPSQKTGESLLKYLRTGTDDVAGGGNQYGVAEDYLKAQGIPGIRYLDGNSRGVGGTSNYVLFDDQLPRILEVNGQPTGLLSWADEAAQANKAMQVSPPYLNSPSHPRMDLPDVTYAGRGDTWAGYPTQEAYQAKLAADAAQASRIADAYRNGDSLTARYGIRLDQNTQPGADRESQRMLRQLGLID